MAQTRQPLTNKNGGDGTAQDGRKGNGEEMGYAQMKQELAEESNTVAHLRKSLAQYKRQRSE